VSRPWLLVVAVVIGVVASIAMIAAGWPERTPSQVVLLELAALPLQFAVAIGLAFLASRTRPLGRRGRIARWVCVGLAALGLLLVALAYATGARGLVHPGLALVWLGLLAAMVLLVVKLPRRRAGSLVSIIPAEEDDEVGDDSIESERD